MCKSYNFTRNYHFYNKVKPMKVFGTFLRRWLFFLVAMLLCVWPREICVAQTNFLMLCKTGTATQVQDAIHVGADVHERSEAGMFPIMLSAAHNEDEGVTEALLRAGANANVEDKHSWTPLMIAAWKNRNPKVTKALLRAGAKPNAKDKNSNTLLMIAVANTKSAEIIKLLTKAGADIHAKDKSGWTPLMIAAVSSDNPEVIKILLEAGSNVHTESNQGNTALTYARSRDSGETKEKVIHYLRTAGALR